jgi:adenine/guanine phosphoribosyltransferase-like PRPP-binding protein
VATEKLIRRAGGQVVGFAFLVELTFLGGAERLGADRVVSLLKYERA